MSARDYTLGNPASGTFSWRHSSVVLRFWPIGGDAMTAAVLDLLKK